jgi:hypothetical protein
MRASKLFGAVVLAFLLPTLCFAQGSGNTCMPTGRWYGGSEGAKYHLTVTFNVHAYSVMFQGVYQNAPVETKWTGEILRKGDHYEGGAIQLTTTAASFPAPPPSINAVWFTFRMPDCDTILADYPFFGIYSADSIWAATGAKVPFRDKPDVNMLAILGVTSIQETYHRVPTECKACPVIP